MRANATRQHSTQTGTAQPRSYLAPARPFAAPQPVQRVAESGTDAQRERSAGLGHDFGRISVRHGGPTPAAARVNRTGLPDRLKAGIEHLSGLSMDDVRVHRNSPTPERLNAAAHTQGTHIHVSPGQEAFLPHEAWHVVQQKRGRVAPTSRVNGMGVNAHPALEREADVMGARAAGQHAAPALPLADASPAQSTVAQCGNVLSKPQNPGKPKISNDQMLALIQERIRQLEATKPKPGPPPKPRLPLEQRKALRRYPRQVTREDALIDSSVGTYASGKGQPKASREPVTGNLNPAGTGVRPKGGPVTAKDHLLGRFPTKGQSSRISFANRKKAQELRDYTKETQAPAVVDDEKEPAKKPVTVTLKARKLMRARLKGKPDATAQVHTSNDLVRQINAETNTALATKKPGSKAALELASDAVTTKGYVRRDAEVQSEGTVPRRFLDYSDDPRPHVPDSDSDSDAETDYSEDEL